LKAKLYSSHLEKSENWHDSLLKLKIKRTSRWFWCLHTYRAQNFKSCKLSWPLVGCESEGCDLEGNVFEVACKFRLGYVSCEAWAACDWKSWEFCGTYVFVNINHCSWCSRIHFEYLNFVVSQRQRRDTTLILKSVAICQAVTSQTALCWLCSPWEFVHSQFAPYLLL
jgi:hypothetical protein